MAENNKQKESLFYTAAKAALSEESFDTAAKAALSEESFDTAAKAALSAASGWVAKEAAEAAAQAVEKGVKDAKDAAQTGIKFLYGDKAPPELAAQPAAKETAQPAAKETASPAKTSPLAPRKAWKQRSLGDKANLVAVSAMAVFFVGVGATAAGAWIKNSLDQPLAFAWQAHDEKARWDAGGEGTRELHKKVAAQIAQCVEDGSCVKMTGKGSDAQSVVDLPRTGKSAVDCQDACDLPGGRYTSAIHLEAKPNGDVVEWAESRGEKVGYVYHPRVSGRGVEWSAEEFTR